MGTDSPPVCRSCLRSGRTTAHQVAIAALGAALVLATGACGDGDGDGGDGNSRSAGPPVVEIGDAARHDGEVVVLEGFLVAQAEGSRLCTALAESFPPQCGGDEVGVDGLDPGRVPGTSTNDDAPANQRVVWTDEPLRLTGSVSGGRLSLLEASADLGRPAVVVLARTGTGEPVGGHGIELWREDGPVFQSFTDGLGVAVFLVAPGPYEVVGLPGEGLPTPVPEPVTLGDATAAVTLVYG